MLGEATLDVSGTFLGEAIRFLILFAAQQVPPLLTVSARFVPQNLLSQPAFETLHWHRSQSCGPVHRRGRTIGELDWRKARTAMRISRHPWQAIHRIVVAKSGNRLAGGRS